MEMVKFPVESVFPTPTCAPIVPLVMANAATDAPFTGPFTTVPLMVPPAVVVPPLLPPPQARARRRKDELTSAASVEIRIFKECLSIGPADCPQLLQGVRK